MIAMIALLVVSLDLSSAPPQTIPFTSLKYGLKVELPKEWEVAIREEEDRVFVATIAQADPRRPGVAACEIGLAPESLDDYRTRLEGNAARNRRPGGTLIRNQVVKGKAGDRLETEWEFRPGFGGVWREISVRKVLNRQLYVFTLNVDDATYPLARPAFDAMIASAKFTVPNTGADPAGKGRWLQREFRFAINLPEGWSPVLAPTEVALFYANGPARGIWSDNVLVLAHPHRRLDLKGLQATFPDELRRAEPGCEVLSCKVIPQGTGEALETVVRTNRGPFSMTVLERRFRGERFDYEVKYTIESKRFDALAPELRKSLDSFAEMPGELPKGGPTKSA
jgi:hypothetical protein